MSGYTIRSAVGVWEGRQHRLPRLDLNILQYRCTCALGGHMTHTCSEPCTPQPTSTSAAKGTPQDLKRACIHTYTHIHTHTHTATYLQALEHTIHCHVGVCSNKDAQRLLLLEACCCCFAAASLAARAACSTTTARPSAHVHQEGDQGSQQGALAAPILQNACDARPAGSKLLGGKEYRNMGV
eukprot:1159249-Pelagomonas_calceolata.AAC.1